jgi:hypothetical protein
MNEIAKPADFERGIAEAEELFIAAGQAKVRAEAQDLLACADWESAALDAETLRAQAEAKRMRFEAWRTANATKRAQMNLR